MAEYIERGAFIELVKDIPMWGSVAAMFADRIPAADVAPVVHARRGTGRFNLETGNYEEQCTRCRNFSKEYGKPYCPNYGAKMDGGDSGEVD